MGEKLDALSRVVPAQVLRLVEEVPVCRCGAFRADCLVPDGDGAIALCWYCAHAKTDHASDEPLCCACPAEEILPSDVIARHRATTTLRYNYPASVPSAAPVLDARALALKPPERASDPVIGRARRR